MSIEIPYIYIYILLYILYFSDYSFSFKLTFSTELLIINTLYIYFRRKNDVKI